MRPFSCAVSFRRALLRQVLSLRGNAMGPHGVDEIARALTSNGALSTLNVADNALGPGARETLSRVPGHASGRLSDDLESQGLPHRIMNVLPALLSLPPAPPPVNHAPSLCSRRPVHCEGGSCQSCAHLTGCRVQRHRRSGGHSGAAWLDTARRTSSASAVSEHS